MCVLLALRPQGRPGRLWIAANRDERLDRPWVGPEVLVPSPPVYGGRDLVGEGSWLALNAAGGFVVGVTNAVRGARPGERSRGRLVVDLAEQESLAAALALLTELDLSRYGLFNLLVADRESIWTATNVAGGRVAGHDERVVVVGNSPLEAPADRLVEAASNVRGLVGSPPADPFPDLAALLSDHGGDDPLCRHGEGYGTVCSTVILMEGTSRVRYLFAPGPPCSTPYEELEVPGAP